VSDGVQIKALSGLASSYIMITAMPSFSLKVNVKPFSTLLLAHKFCFLNPEHPVEKSFLRHRQQ